MRRHRVPKWWRDDTDPNRYDRTDIGHHAGEVCGVQSVHHYAGTGFELGLRSEFRHRFKSTSLHIAASVQGGLRPPLLVASSTRRSSEEGGAQSPALFRFTAFWKD